MSEIVHSPATRRDGHSSRRTGQILQSMKLLEQAVTPTTTSFSQAYGFASPNTEVTPGTGNISRYLNKSQTGSRYLNSHQSMISEFSTTTNQNDFATTMHLLQPTTPAKFAVAELNTLNYATIEDPGMAKFKQKYRKFQFSASQKRRDRNNLASGAKLSKGVHKLSDIFDFLLLDSVIINVTATKVTAGMFGDFKDCLFQHNSSSEVFQLLDAYEEVCSDYERLLAKVMPQVISEAQRDTVQDIKRGLTNEKQTWRLLNAMYRDRLAVADEEMTVDSGIESLSEKTAVDEYFRQNSDIRQAQIVIDWLERNGADELAGVSNRLQHYSGRALWENTLYHLKKNEENGNPPDPSFITEMDPDAPSRTRRPLHELDREDDARLLKCIFSCIRGGKIDEAEDLCVMHGQPWRVAALEGWRLFHDPNTINACEDGGYVPVEGNARRDMWKATAWACSNDTAFDIQERAIFAALCGNLNAMLSVSLSWHDAVWAYYKAMVDMETEKMIQRSPHITRPWQHMHPMSLPEEYFLQKCDLNDLNAVFDKIACSSDEFAKEAKIPHFFIQRCIILNDMKSLVNEMTVWLEEGKVNDQLLRFFAHLLLFLQSVEGSLDVDKCSVVLEAYVKRLIREERTGGLVATYTASLPTDKQLSCYASFLEGIDDSEMRRKYVELAEASGLDVAAITKNVVERIRASVGADSFSLSGDETPHDPTLDPPLSADDKRKIEAIEWLVFDPAQRAEALRQSNAVVRGFLATRKHTAARQVLQKLPRDSIDTIHKEWHALADKDVPLPPEIENAEREHLCLQALLSAQSAFSDWFKHFHNKPRPYLSANQPSAYSDVSMTDLVAEEQRLKAHEEEVRRWKEVLERLCDESRDKIYNVLLFPNGGWMVDARQAESSENDEETQCRHHQMQLLRRLYVPSLCDLLLNASLDTGSRHEQCVQLADVVAAEENKLYKLFTIEEGRKFLSRIQDAMIETI